MADHEEKQTSPAKRGAGYKRPGQKYKSLLVWQVLLNRTGAEYPLSVDDIQDHLRMYGAYRFSPFQNLTSISAKNLYSAKSKSAIPEREYHFESTNA